MGLYQQQMNTREARTRVTKSHKVAQDCVVKFRLWFLVLLVVYLECAQCLNTLFF
jgi:hypothetical protein